MFNRCSGWCLLSAPPRYRAIRSTHTTLLHTHPPFSTSFWTCNAKLLQEYRVVTANLWLPFSHAACILFSYSWLYTNASVHTYFLSLLHHSVRRTPTQLLHSHLPFSTRFPLRRPLHWLPAFVLCNHCTVKSTPLTSNSVPTKSTLYAHILLRLLRNRTHIEHVIIRKLPISFDIFLAFLLLPVDGTADPR